MTHKRKKKVKILSLGCRLNQSEIQSVVTQLQDRGHDVVSEENAEVYVINSCIVTQRSERKTEKFMKQAHKAHAALNNSMTIVTGCYAKSLERNGDTWFVSNDYKYLIPEIIDNPDKLNEIITQGESRFSYPPATKSTRTRINLKIQDGCSNYCSYCIIPYARGESISRSLEDILVEFRTLRDAGYKEFLLTGVMIGNYSDAGKGLSDLVESILSEKGEYRLHLSSLSPASADSHLLKLLRHERMVKHVHLSLQSGSNRILKSMNRHYTREEYLDIIKTIRARDHLFNVTTDLIVGFPGETEEDFQESLTLVQDANFSHVHTFKFSPRDGTVAADMSDTVPENEKGRRSRAVMDISTKQKRAYLARFNGARGCFLSEHSKGDITHGFNEYYVPVRLSPSVERNRFYDVKTLYREGDGYLAGRIVE